MIRTLGIDLGTTFSEVSVYLGTSAQLVSDYQNARHIQSIANISNIKNETKITVGSRVYKNKTLNQLNTIYDTKRMLGKKFNDENIQKMRKKWPFKIEESETGDILISLDGISKKYQPYEISGEILKYIAEVGNKRFASENRTNDVVITIPANFGEKQRTETKKAAQYANLNVLGMINEPTAAGIAFGILHPDAREGKHYLFYDFGGGTLDISVIYFDSNGIKVEATGGNMFLGGRDFDERTRDYLIEKLGIDADTLKNQRKMHKLLDIASNAKIDLSNDDRAEIDFNGHEYSLTLSEFEEINAEFISKLTEPIDGVLKDAGLTKDMIEKVALVGGSSNMRCVRKKIGDFFGEDKLFSPIDVQEAVSMGASILAQRIIQDQQIPEWIRTCELIEICPFSIGTSNDITGEMEILIPKGTSVPVEKSCVFTTIYYRQTDFYVNVLEGENDKANKNAIIGGFYITNLPESETILYFEVIFYLDFNGILSATAHLIGIKDDDNNNKPSKTIEINICRVRTTNNNIDICEVNSYENELKVFLENIKRYINFNKESILKFYSENHIEQYLKEINDLLKQIHNESSTVDIRNLAINFFNSFITYFNKENNLPFFVKKVAPDLDQSNVKIRKH